MKKTGRQDCLQTGSSGTFVALGAQTAETTGLWLRKLAGPFPCPSDFRSGYPESTAIASKGSLFGPMLWITALRNASVRILPACLSNPRDNERKHTPSCHANPRSPCFF